jgi:hypothetical protein
MNFDAATIAGLLRHILTFGGGFLVTNGTLTDVDLQTGVGAAVALFALAWSIWAKRKVA